MENKLPDLLNLSRTALVGINTALNEMLGNLEEQLKVAESKMKEMVDNANMLDHHNEYLNLHAHEKELSAEQLKEIDG